MMYTPAMANTSDHYRTRCRAKQAHTSYIAVCRDAFRSLVADERCLAPLHTAATEGYTLRIQKQAWQETDPSFVRARTKVAASATVRDRSFYDNLVHET